ncbi:MAG: xylulokinase [Chloroflexi bacterium]|nr:MAG: xylulokinase [Chloroflexota bacterium]
MAKPDEGSLIGLDVGTTGARAVAIDLAGDILAAATEEYPMAMPRPGWTEQEPEDWWAASRAVLSSVISETSQTPLALGLTGQMHGAVFLDESDSVIRPALLWNDQRTQRQCRDITETVGPQRLVQVTGNPALTGFQAPKILWLRDEEPAAYARLRRVLLPKDYVRLRLTGEYATDVSDASGTLLLDLRKRRWSDEILDALAIPGEWLPAVHEGPDITGAVTASAAGVTGLRAGLIVAAGGGDNAAGAVGNGIVRPGAVSSSVGTSGVVFAHSDEPVIDSLGRLHSFCHALPGAYHVMGVTLSAGGSLRWWRDIAVGNSYDALAALANQAPPGAGGLVFLPYLSGERTPVLDPAARGAFVGLNMTHTLAHLTRAVMEGVVHSLKQCLDLIAALPLPITDVRATGGGARNPVWRQLQADIFGMPVYRNAVDEGPAFGAALLAGLACGAYASVLDVTSRIRLGPDVTEPDPDASRLYREYHEVYASLYASTSGAMHRLSALGGASLTF